MDSAHEILMDASNAVNANADFRPGSHVAIPKELAERIWAWAVADYKLYVGK